MSDNHLPTTIPEGAVAPPFTVLGTTIFEVTLIAPADTHPPNTVSEVTLLATADTDLPTTIPEVAGAPPFIIPRLGPPSSVVCRPHSYEGSV